MISYVSTGTRHFGRRPLTPHARQHWEFYAVLHGRIAPSLPGARPEKLRASSLWVFPAGAAHGWIGDPEKSARVAVFHYDAVPPELSAVIAKRGVLRATLTAADRALVQTSARLLLPVFWRDQRLDTLLAQRVLLDLTLLLLRRERGARVDGGTSGSNRVNAAENWFRLHMSERPNLRDIAYRLGTSASHLGKLFRAERGCSPKIALRRIQMNRATELLRDNDDKLDVIATACGFAKAASFCTMFKRHSGHTPAEYRRQSRTDRRFAPSALKRAK